ncbi:MAG: protein phosphatase 2C domain-containing protein [Methanomicrobiales archaeon]|nr:protein phosphatase 2C domain-containing protein [Methanomicrobiales archaeon]
MRWKQAGASVTGKAHSSRGESGQDFSKAGSVQIADTHFFIGLAADGAGSTTDGGRGAEIACTTLWEQITAFVRDEPDISKITDNIVKDWITQARAAVDIEADHNGKKPRDYATTILGAVAGPDLAVYFQIGDGAIVTGSGTMYDTVFWPEQGEYANTTFFLTDEKYQENLKIRFADAPDEIALFTDGLQTLVLSFATRTAHAGFFSPLFAALRASPADGIGALSLQLAPFLLREDISARSDDDKTLVLAVRIAG